MLNELQFLFGSVLHFERLQPYSVKFSREGGILIASFKAFIKFSET